jgi:tRNA threonylcarbamoyladenosine biosynthesis protein TsaB
MILTNKDIKPILAIETSNELCSVSVYYNENKFFTSEVLLKNSHSEKLFGLIDFVFSQAKVELSECRCIAVSSGPGSFTGLRIGIAAAKGLALGASIPIALVPTFDAAAFQVSRFLPENTKYIITSKVNNDDLYISKYVTVDDSFENVTPLEIIPNEELESKADGCMVFGNINYNYKKDKIFLPNAEFIARWLERYGESLITKDYDFLEPNYFKNFIVKERKK